MENKILKPDLNTEKMNQIASQLSCPTGEDGIAMGELLNSTNSGMITESIKLLQLSDKKRVLELGHGNCGHLQELLSKAFFIRYFGMEISEVMQQEAARINSKFINKRQALFQLYNGQDIPYVLNFFDRILSVNTIYFWENPSVFLTEIYRVLKPNGICVLTFAKSSCMQKLPFTTDTTVFTLYDNQKFKQLVKSTSFTLVSITDKIEPVKSKSGELVNREYSIAVLTKNKL